MVPISVPLSIFSAIQVLLSLPDGFLSPPQTLFPMESQAIQPSQVSIVSTSQMASSPKSITSPKLMMPIHSRPLLANSSSLLLSTLPLQLLPPQPLLSMLPKLSSCSQIQPPETSHCSVNSKSMPPLLLLQAVV